MKCEQVVEGVQDFLLDLLDPEVRTEIETHVRSCGDCAGDLEKARKALSVLNEWQPRAPLKSKTTRRSLPRPATPPLVPALAVAGAILILAALAVVDYRRRHEGDPGSLEQRTSQVDVPPPAPPDPAVAVPEPERPRTEKPAPAPEVVVPSASPAVPPPTPPPAPPSITPPVESKEKKTPEIPAPAVAKTVAAALARVERVKGDVLSSGERVSEGLELRPGERLFTRGSGSLASVRCPGLIRLELGGATVIRYDGPDGVLLEQGKLDAEVPKAFVFATFNATVEVSEARFTLERKDDVTVLQVRQGTVQFMNLVTGKLLQARPGQNVKAEGHPKVDQRKVDAAVANGIAFLRGRLAGLKGGTDNLELVLYTLLHGGVSDKDPEVRTLLQNLLALEPQKTYNTALRAMVLEKIDRVRYQEEIWKCAQYLLDNQTATGLWGYGTPTQYGPMPKRVPTGTATGGRPRAVDFSDKTVRHRVSVAKNRDGSGGDNSNSQYAALGLRACHDAGIDLPKDAISLARKWLLDCQLKEEVGAGKDAVATGGIAAPPRGWGYNRGYLAYGSMTAGAIGSVCIYDYILDGEKTLSWKRDPAVLSGLAWLAHNFSPTGNALVDKAVNGNYSLIPDGAMYYYYLYAVERAGLLFGTEKFGGREWYPEGAAVLLKNQQADGSWPPADTHRNPVWDTCFSILFLRRATRPLMDVASEDKFKKPGADK